MMSLLQFGSAYADPIKSFEPEMVIVPAGKFLMGTEPYELDRGKDEGPRHWVNIARPFAVGKYEVTFAEWDYCVADGGCNGYRPDDNGWGRGNRPVINVSWKDAHAYIDWLNRKTGKKYRLLSEAEWEYSARAGTTTVYFWGNDAGLNHANCYRCDSLGGKKKTVPVDSFQPNAFGLYNMLGNVWEWTQDCWNNSYNGAPANGRSWNTGDCSLRVNRGGSWLYGPSEMRAANRDYDPIGDRDNNDGFRLARTLP